MACPHPPFTHYISSTYPPFQSSRMTGRASFYGDVRYAISKLFWTEWTIWTNTNQHGRTRIKKKRPSLITHHCSLFTVHPSPITMHSIPLYVIFSLYGAPPGEGGAELHHYRQEREKMGRKVIWQEMFKDEFEKAVEQRPVSGFTAGQR